MGELTWEQKYDLIQQIRNTTSLDELKSALCEIIAALPGEEYCTDQP